MELDREKIEAAIVREVADRLISEDDIYSRVNRNIDARVDKVFAERVEERLSEAVNSVILEGFDRPFQRRDSFGRATGEPTTISKELEKLVGSYWNEKVDRQGKKASDSYNATTRAEWLMATICAEGFQKEVKAHAVNVTGALKDAFRRELHSTVDGLLSELFHVRSLGDQGLGRQDRSSIDPKAGPVGGA